MSNLMTVEWCVYILLAAAFFHACGELIVLTRWYRSWIPRIFYEWDLGKAFFDAGHTYRGLGLTLFSIAMGIAFVTTYCYDTAWWWPVAVWAGFYQARNFWMHMGLLWPSFWKIPPFFRIIWDWNRGKEV